MKRRKYLSIDSASYICCDILERGGPGMLVKASASLWVDEESLFLDTQLTRLLLCEGKRDMSKYY